jgi:hypothetical protein
LHDRMFRSVVNSKMEFFDKNPIGEDDFCFIFSTFDYL